MFSAPGGPGSPPPAGFQRRYAWPRVNADRMVGIDPSIRGFFDGRVHALGVSQSQPKDIGELKQAAISDIGYLKLENGIPGFHTTHILAPKEIIDSKDNGLPLCGFSAYWGRTIYAFGEGGEPQLWATATDSLGLGAGPLDNAAGIIRTCQPLSLGRHEEWIIAPMGHGYNDISQMKGAIWIKFHIKPADIQDRSPMFVMVMFMYHLAFRFHSKMCEHRFEL